MNNLYLLLNLGSFAIPFLFSFHPRLKFYRYWKPLFFGILITMLVFIPWDVIFTINGIWGFNDNYFIGTKLLSLPLEEWLFFICIPYACIFTHFALLELFPGMQLNESKTTIITIIIFVLLILLSIFYYDKWYTIVNFLYALILLLIVRTYCPEILKSYFITFLVILIPFFIINGILTGSQIENEVVWYNNDENMNFRILTIPIEDIVYAFSLILTNLSLTQFFYKKLN
jgi:lycopene cyclase domain-containing protein